MTYVLCFLAWCFFTACLVSGQPLTYGLQGQETTLETDITEQPDNILWKHNGNKVIEFNGNEEQVYGSYLNRVVLNWVSAELQIKDLRYEDSGKYDLEIFRKKNQAFITLNYNLEVIGSVSKPTISCEMNKSSSDTAEDWATLTCSADPVHPRSLMKFEWVSPVKVQPGHQLTISLKGDELYTCRVSNPLSSESVTFMANDCHSGESSPVALAVSISVVLLFLLFGLLAILYFKRKVCCANRDDGPRSDLKEGPNQEYECLIGRNPTFLSTQRLPQTQEYNVVSCDWEQEPVNVKKMAQMFEQKDGYQNQSRGSNRKNERPASPLGRKKEIADADPDPRVHAEEDENASSDAETTNNLGPDVKQTAAPEEPEHDTNSEEVTQKPGSMTEQEEKHERSASTAPLDKKLPDSQNPDSPPSNHKENACADANAATNTDPDAHANADADADIYADADADADIDADADTDADADAHQSRPSLDSEKANDPGVLKMQNDLTPAAAPQEPEHDTNSEEVTGKPVLKENRAAKTKPPIPVRPVALTGGKPFGSPGNLPSNHKGKADTAADAHANADSPDTQKENDSDPADVLEVQTAAAPEEPELKKKADEKEDANTSAANVSSPPTTDLTQNSGTEDAAGEHENDATSDEVNNETSGENVKESDSPSKNGQLPINPTQNSSESFK